ncbi:metallophosphoesterase [Methylophaga nitratireducenticrescens]|nr:metallophosphoesterase [Methylophaga nitratireducenticrescens]AUZ83135.1 metallophosphoesterase [Methylophaga nitratireducenticrescens]
MTKLTQLCFIFIGFIFLSGFNASGVAVVKKVPESIEENGQFLSDPFLQLPTLDSVNVVWFTNFAGQSHQLHYGDGLIADATTTKMTRTFEDADSSQPGRDYQTLTLRKVYRHEATATSLTAGVRLNYQVKSITDEGQILLSDSYSLAPLPEKNTPLKILLTSDLQSKTNAPANYQKVVETIGQPDAVFFAGDLVNIPDRASEWFDQIEDGAPPFFPTLQGRYQKLKPDSVYNGGEILQHTPLFAAIGNHEVMGRFLPQQPDHRMNNSFNDPQPRWYAEIAYEQIKQQINPDNDPPIKAQWLLDNSHNQHTYLEIFSFPEDGPRGKEYYAMAFGDVFLISMNVSRIWRSWNVSGQHRSKFVEALSELQIPDAWGFGEFMFERFDAHSQQYQWLESVLQSEAFKQAKFKVVLAHQGIFGLGDNVVPVLANPLMQLVETDGNDIEKLTELTFPISPQDWQNTVLPMLPNIREIRYQYPLSDDIWRRDIEPLLVKHGVDLVQIGHSHLWNRTKVGRMHYLETSNVGNTLGAYYNDPTGIYLQNNRNSKANFWIELNSENSRWDPATYAANGDPHGRQMIHPSFFSPMHLLDKAFPKLPFVSSNQLTTFSILDTGTATVKSYVFDTADPVSEVQLFDEFSIGN